MEGPSDDLNVPISAPPSKGIHAALVKIMSEIGGVAKGRRNTQQNYSFRGIADIYLAAQPLLAKHGVHMSPHAVLSETVVDRETKAGSLNVHVRQRIEFRFYHEDGSFVPCVTTGEAMDTGDKASNKCMSAAAKYALIVTFAIPEEDPDVDTENTSPDAKAPPARAAAATAAAPPARASRAKPPRSEPDGPTPRPAETASIPAPLPPPEPLKISPIAPGVPTSEIPEGNVPIYVLRAGKFEHVASGPPLNRTQQARVKILQKELGIGDDEWIAKLTVYYGKTSSSQLTGSEADSLAVRLEARKAIQLPP